MNNRRRYLLSQQAVTPAIIPLYHFPLLENGIEIINSISPSATSGVTFDSKMGAFYQNNSVARYLRYSNSISLANVSRITLEIYPTVTNQQGYILACQGATNNFSTVISAWNVNSNIGLNVGHGNSATAYLDTAPTSTLNYIPNQWNTIDYIIGKTGNTTVTITVNGISQTYTLNGSILTKSMLASMTIGCPYTNTANRTFQGYIRNLKMYE